MTAAVERLVSSAKKFKAQDKCPFKLVPIADLVHVKPEAPSYLWEGLVPIEYTTLWSAHGETGKSFVSTMLAVAASTGRSLFGIPTHKCKALVFSAEDSADLVRYRLHFICGAMTVNIAELQDRLEIIDATAERTDPTLYAEQTIGARRTASVTTTFENLRDYVQKNEIGLVIVDNASDVYDCSEIERAKVRGFMRALASLARECKAAVILLAHVDKGTSRGERARTESYSGSTAWHNSARSRMTMYRDKDGALVIDHQKHNLGPKHEPIRLVWPKGGVPQLEQQFGPVVQGIADRGYEGALLKLIHEFTSRGEHITTATSSRTHAAKLLRNEPTFPRVKDTEVFDILRKAERAGHLERTVIKQTNRHEKECWCLTQAGMTFARIAAPTAPTAPTSAVGAPIEVDAEDCADCADLSAGGVGVIARAQVDAEDGP